MTQQAKHTKTPWAAGWTGASPFCRPRKHGHENCGIWLCHNPSDLWSDEDVEPGSQICITAHGRGGVCTMMVAPCNEQNTYVKAWDTARFICRAVNAHEELVAALLEADTFICKITREWLDREVTRQQDTDINIMRRKIWLALGDAGIRSPHAAKAEGKEQCSPSSQE